MFSVVLPYVVFFFFVFLVLWSWIRLPNISYLSEQSFWNLSNSFGNIQQMTTISYVNFSFVKFFEICFPYISLIFFRGSHFQEIFYLAYPTFCSANFRGPSPKNLITLFGHPLLRGAARVPRKKITFDTHQSLSGWSHGTAKLGGNAPC